MSLDWCRDIWMQCLHILWQDVLLLMVRSDQWMRMPHAQRAFDGQG